MGPDADTGEKVALGKSSEVVRCDIFNTPFVNFARGDMPGGYEVTQPLRREWVDLVVVSCRAHAASVFTTSMAQPGISSTEAVAHSFPQWLQPGAALRLKSSIRGTSP